MKKSENKSEKISTPPVNWGGLTNSLLTLYNNGGKFYYAYKTDSFILSLLFGYKIIDGRCGFPDNALDKVVSRMNLEKIDYEIITSKEVLITKIAHYKPNNYNKIAKKALHNIKLTEKIKLLEEKVLNLKEQELIEIIEYINERY